jgi:hypothetical protein
MAAAFLLLCGTLSSIDRGINRHNHYANCNAASYHATTTDKNNNSNWIDTILLSLQRSS